MYINNRYNRSLFSVRFDLQPREGPSPPSEFTFLFNVSTFYRVKESIKTVPDRIFKHRFTKFCA